MEGIFLGKVDQTAFDPRCVSLSFGTKHLDQQVEVRKELDYDCDYVLVKADDVIKTNDELLRLRDEVKQWDDECSEWKKLYAKVNNELFQKGLAYSTLETAYKNEKIAGEMLLKDRDALKEKVEKLEAELTEIKTARTLREAYIAGVEKGCESLREERDRWKRRWNSVVTDIGESLKANGITFVLKEIHGDGNWDLVIDIPELNRVKAENDKLRGMITTNFRDLLKESGINFELTQPNSPESLTLKFDIPELTEAKAKVADLEKKLEAAKSNETFWRDRKEEEEDYHHYWLHTFDRAVKQAAEKGIHIGVRGNDDECNAGIVTLDNMKAEELEKQIVQMEDANKKLNQKIGAADNALEYWNNTYNDIVIAGKKVGVKIDIKGKKPDDNAGFVYVTNEKAEDLEKKIKRLEDDNSAKADALVNAKDRGDYWLREHDVKSRMYQELEQKHDAKWTAMCDALKAKGVEVIYMGEEDGKPIVDVKVPKLDELQKESDARAHQIDLLVGIVQVNNERAEELKKELEDLKSKKISTCSLEAGADGKLTFIYTYMDGHNEAASFADLCKNYVAFDAENISCGTVPKCKSCAHYMHKGDPFAGRWCYKAIHKEGPKFIRRLSTEEAEGPACSDFKTRKE